MLHLDLSSWSRKESPLKEVGLYRNPIGSIQCRRLTEVVRSRESIKRSSTVIINTGG